MYTCMRNMLPHGSLLLLALDVFDHGLLLSKYGQHHLCAQRVSTVSGYC